MHRVHGFRMMICGLWVNGGDRVMRGGMVTMMGGSVVTKMGVR